MSKLIRLIAVGVFVSFGLASLGQTNSNSPFSYYGLGEIETADYGLTSGMSGVGIALKSGRYVNRINPASYSNIDSLRFIFDVSFYGNSSKFESNSSEYSFLAGNVKKVAIGFRANSKCALSFGLIPYSSIGYKVKTLKEIEGSTDKFCIESTGEGGLSRVYLGSSLKLGEHSSLGINASVLFGSIKRSEQYSNDIDNETIKVTESSRLKTKMYFDFGYQYSNSINKKLGYTIGVVGGINTKLQFSKYSITEIDESSSTEELNENYDYWIPAYAGIGFSIFSEKWNFVADYKLQQWGSFRKKNDSNWLTNSYHYAIGIEYSPEKRLAKNIFKTLTYQVGSHIDKSYVNQGGKNVYDYGVSVGVLVPLRNQLSSIGVSFETGRKGFMSDKYFREKYHQVTLSINMNDVWFMKRRFN